jgi:UDP-N-acetylmuramate dehydrogenase
MEILRNQPLGPLTTMKLGGNASYLCSIKNKEDVIEAVNFAKSNNLTILTMGSGSNIIFSDYGYNGLIVINELTGFEISPNGAVESLSGENWDNLVELTVANGLSGLESLSLIPGTVGGGPVNNIGAYGQEIKDVLVSVEAYDTYEQKFVELSNAECKFEYRNSVFKSSEYGRYIIIKVNFQLEPIKNIYTAPSYPSLEGELSKFTKISPATVRQAVINVRTSKLPDPNVLPNTGSFFKNPFVSTEKAKELIGIYPAMPQYPINDKVKIPAGWLIDNAGLKNLKKYGIWIYDKQALVLVNDGAKSYVDLQNMIQYIKDTIQEKYGIALDIEPEIIL